MVTYQYNFTKRQVLLTQLYICCIILIDRGDRMDKEKILQVAQKSQVDERQTFVSVKGALLSLFITMIVVLFILIWKAIHGDNVADMGLVLISQIIGFSVYQYIKLPERKLYLVIIALGAIFFIVNLVVFINSYGVA